MKYPKVLSESDTLDRILAGASIARWGDGEWRCSIGGGCTSQRPDPKLMAELQQAIRPGNAQGRDYIVGIPNPFGGCPREESWIRYTEPKFARQLEAGAAYHSSFITRPDNAPWIDTKEYWARVRRLWLDQSIVLAVGDKKSVTSEMIAGDCKLIAEVWGPRQHAYSEIDRIEAEIIQKARLPEGGYARVLLCLGASATVLAFRLAKRGIHAIDMGHIGMFMRHAGAYHYAMNDLSSQGYRNQLEKLHKTQRWGADGAKHVKPVMALHVKCEPKTLLDYGCGEMKLAAALAPIRVQGYDPGIPERAKMPKPCDMVVCTDVLEHVEPTKIDAVLDHIWRLTAKAAYLVISLKPANAILPDGRNAHLIVETAAWWIDKLNRTGWAKLETFDSGKELRVDAWK